MSESVTDSRFYMWRAVFALAHSDHVVTNDEKALAEQYFEPVPFSDEQKAVLRQDLVEAQDVGEMFERISDRADQGDFFGFARLMVWCDGDFDQQEDVVFDKLKDLHMWRLNPDALRKIIQDSREEFDTARVEEDQAYRERAKELVSLKRLFSFLEK